MNSALSVLQLHLPPFSYALKSGLLRKHSSISAISKDAMLFSQVLGSGFCSSMHAMVAVCANSYQSGSKWNGVPASMKGKLPSVHCQYSVLIVLEM